MHFLFAAFQPGFGFLGQPFLFFIVVEKDSPVLPRPGPAVGVVAFPEQFQQFPVRDA